MEMNVEIRGYEFSKIEQRIIEEFKEEMRRKIDFNLLQKQVRNQIVKEIKKEIQKEVRDAINIEILAKNVEDVARNHAMNRINERLKEVKITI